jgi:hypothetical protein
LRREDSERAAASLRAGSFARATLRSRVQDDDCDLQWSDILLEGEIAIYRYEYIELTGS